MTRKADKVTLEKLEEEGKKRGLPQRFLEFYHRLFQVQSKAEQQIGKAKVSLNRAAITEHLERGLPLITYKELDIDWSLLKKIFPEVLAIFSLLQIKGTVLISGGTPRQTTKALKSVKSPIIWGIALE